ncbi:MAG: DUF2304 domain-containing protein [Patescibacteria group bacterium]|jgi:hypothetical protein
MTNIQIIALVFGFFMAYLSFLHYKRKTLSRYQFVLWEMLWFGLIAATILPDRFNFVTERLGIIRAFDLFSIIAFVIVLFLSFYNYLAVTKLNKRLENKVREKTLEQFNQIINK